MMYINLEYSIFELIIEKGWKDCWKDLIEPYFPLEFLLLNIVDKIYEETIIL
jgi:hypothetical protein